jgi:hypothetical protein
MVNKLMWDVDRSDETLASFKTNSAACLDAWETMAERPVSPYPEGGRLTATERQALESRDYGALYAMGANPFLLWQFARSVSIPEQMDIEQLVTSFRVAVEPHGYPEFHT